MLLQLTYTCPLWNLIQAAQKVTFALPFILLYWVPLQCTVHRNTQHLITLCVYIHLCCVFIVTTGTQTLLCPVSLLYRWPVASLYMFRLCTLCTISSKWTALIQSGLIKWLTMETSGLWTHVSNWVYSCTDVQLQCSPVFVHLSFKQIICFWVD
jgi:hypothetical protein